MYRDYKFSYHDVHGKDQIVTTQEFLQILQDQGCIGKKRMKRKSITKPVQLELNLS